MLSIGIKDLKNQLSRYLLLVKQGEEILVTERGKAIARIVQESSSKSTIQKALQPLVGEGIVTLPSRPIRRDIPEPPEVSGKPLSELVLEGRR